MQTCKNCGADESMFKRNDRLSEIICSNCGYVVERIEDKGLSARVFNENEQTKIRNTTGVQVRANRQQTDRARQAVAEICSVLHIDQGSGRDALEVY